ncbi:hypothetical protein HDU98_003974 [Podochytrium sp. JEL0797]|nr:hypothetical protein HDU98_003974 [Podochytrium sp. JEL0797]
MQLSTLLLLYIAASQSVHALPIARPRQNLQVRQAAISAAAPAIHQAVAVPGIPTQVGTLDDTTTADDSVDDTDDSGLNAENTTEDDTTDAAVDDSADDSTDPVDGSGSADDTEDASTADNSDDTADTDSVDDSTGSSDNAADEFSDDLTELAARAVAPNSSDATEEFWDGTVMSVGDDSSDPTGVVDLYPVVGDSSTADVAATAADVGSGNAVDTSSDSTDSTVTDASTADSTDVSSDAVVTGAGASPDGGDADTAATDSTGSTTMDDSTDDAESDTVTADSTDVISVGDVSADAPPSDSPDSIAGDNVVALVARQVGDSPNISPVAPMNATTSSSDATEIFWDGTVQSVGHDSNDPTGVVDLFPAAA